MSYKVLYRKYRPDSFKKIIGQDTIINILKNSIINKDFSHAYIFTGPRGTGKTSTAKVFAKTINCQCPENGEACNKCDNCLNNNTTPDIIEIDAASNNGVDEIRELKNNINLSPTNSKYKIYIVDEVHMLTTGAFNALLKTLEEPPEHAIFILATTEIHKVPITILSRCQRFDFKKIKMEEMLSHLKMVCLNENIKYDDGVLEEIYSLSDGCARDALSILDQLSKQNEKITLEYIINNYSAISNEKLNQLVVCLKNNDIIGIISILDSFDDNGLSIQKIIKKIINKFEKIAIEIKIGQDNYSFKKISNIIRKLNDCYVDAKINENTISIIKLIFLEELDGKIEREVLSNSNQETKIEMNNEKPKNEEKSNSEITEKTRSELSFVDIRINNCFVEANKKALIDLQNNWNDMNFEIVPGTKLKNYSPVVASVKYAIITIDDDSLVKLFNIKVHEIEENLRKDNINIKLIAITQDQWQLEKEKYKERLKKGEKYDYILEPENNNLCINKAKEEANLLFSEDIVEVL